MDRMKLINEIMRKGPKEDDVREILKRLSDANLIGVAQDLGIDTDKLFGVAS